MLPLKKISLQLWTFTMTVIHSLVFIYEKRENIYPKLIVQEMVCMYKERLIILLSVLVMLWSVGIHHSFTI